MKYEITEAILQLADFVRGLDDFDVGFIVGACVAAFILFAFAGVINR